MNKIEKSILCGFLVAVLAVTASGFSVFAKQCGDIRQNVLRLHILANSDSKADQALKLKVRDTILEKSDDLFQNADSKKQAIDQVSNKLEEIRQIAQEEVYREGYRYPVKAQIVHMYFTTRTYGTYILPAGYYDAVRITIGRAQGHNWWCVLFPPLCFPTAENQAKGRKELDDVLDGKEVGIVTHSQDQTIVLKFKVIELYEDARNFFAEHFGGSSVNQSSGKKAGV